MRQRGTLSNRLSPAWTCTVFCGAGWYRPPSSSVHDALCRYHERRRRDRLWAKVEMCSPSIRIRTTRSTFHQRMKTRRALRFVKGQFGLPPCGIDGAAFPRCSWPPREPGSPPAGRWLATGKETGKLRRRQCGAYRNEGVICSALSEDRRP